MSSTVAPSLQVLSQITSTNMNALKELIDMVLRIVFGQRVADNANEWKVAHDKANASRSEVENIIRESEQHR